MLKTVLNIVTGAVAFALLFVAWVYPEVPTATYAFATVLVLLLGTQVVLHQRELRAAAQTRVVRYGANAIVTLGLVLALLGVVSFMNYSHFYRKDLTQGGLQSLSDQTVKILKDLNQDIKVTVFSKMEARDAVKGLFENYSYHTKKIKVEYVDPDRERERAAAAGIKQYGTIIVNSGKLEARFDVPTEDKFTNAILKVTKSKSVMTCFITGHGEKGIDLKDPENFSQASKQLASQNYESKAINLLEEGKIPTDCSVVLVLGPTKAFFEKEVELLKAWLDGGGRVLVGLDPVLKPDAADHDKALKALLAEWHITVNHNLVVDPTNKLREASPSVPIVRIFSGDHPIGKDFKMAALFPLSSTLELTGGAPPALKLSWVAKSGPESFTKDNFQEIASGQVKVDQKKDKFGPFILMVAAEGARTGEKKPEKSAKLVVMGTSQVATNRWLSYGSNADVFLNSISWLADDESLISIRAKDEATQMPNMTETEVRYIQLLTMFIIPGAVILMGLIVWLRRRKL